MNTSTHKQRSEGNEDNSGKINSDTHDSNPNKYKIDRNSTIVYPPCEICGKRKNSAGRYNAAANAVNRPLPWKSKPQQQDAQDSITGCARVTAQDLN